MLLIPKNNTTALPWPGAMAPELFLCGTEAKLQTPAAAPAQTKPSVGAFRSCWGVSQSQVCNPAAHPLSSLLPRGRNVLLGRLINTTAVDCRNRVFHLIFKGILKMELTCTSWRSPSSLCVHLNTGTGAGGCQGLHLSSQRAEW